MKILLIGKNGQVGGELSRSLISLGDVVAKGHEQFDLANASQMTTQLEDLRPDIIVNAAAYTNVDAAEGNQVEAYQINCEAVALLAKYAQENNSILVHYSTDYVFDGAKTQAYVEDDKTNPINVYGASKLAAEQAILDSGCLGYIFRTSWVYAQHGNNFIKTILRLALSKETLSVIHDQNGAPTSAELISDLTLLALYNILHHKFEPGIYHLTPNGQTSWYELAKYIVSKAREDSGVRLKLKSIVPIASVDYNCVAERPKNSVLNNSKLAESLKIKFPEWSFHVDRLIKQLINIGYLNEA